MNIIGHTQNNMKIAQIQADAILINSAEEGFDLLGNMYHQGYDCIILHKYNITPDFFDLKNGIAGEILQKFSNYRMKLSIVGDFENITSKSLKDFIFESNKHKQINFSPSVEAALEVLSS